MFIVRLLRWLFGWVTFEAEGGFPERLLNLAARGGIPLWNTGRQGITLTACCFARKYRRLRPLARRAGVRLRVRQRHGIPFTLQRYHARAGVAIGLAAYVVLLQVLSSRIWVVEVSGSQKVPEKEILAVVEELGVRQGGRIDRLDMQQLQIEALQKLPDLVWLTVNPEGSIAHVEVAERVPTPTVTDKTAPSNIKAARDGRILRMEVTGGQAAVKEGDAVTGGMLLVSGVMDTTAGPVFRKAEARIWAETSRQLQVAVPLREMQELEDGHIVYRPTLELFGFCIPFYSDGPLEGNYRLVEKEHALTANGLKLPLRLVNRYYHRLVSTEIQHTEEEAAVLAAELLAQKEGEELADAEIRERRTDGRLEDGYYVLTGRYTCVEDIGTEEPLLVTDSAGK